MQSAWSDSYKTERGSRCIVILMYKDTILLRLIGGGRYKCLEVYKTALFVTSYGYDNRIRNCLCTFLLTFFEGYQR